MGIRRNSFIALQDIKETNPVEISEYVLANQLEKEPEFSWWIRTALKRRDTMTSKVYRRVRKKMKFGIHLPDTYEEAVRMDKERVEILFGKMRRRKR